MRAAKPAWPVAGTAATVRSTTVGRPCQTVRAMPKRAAHPSLQWFGFASLFLLGDVCGVLLGRGFDTVLGTALAEYALSSIGDPSYWSRFASLFATGFLQATLLLASGYCAVGAGVCGLFFALRGAYLGFCAANLYLLHGLRTLTVYWLGVFLPAAAMLVPLFRVAVCALPLSRGLWQSVFCGGAPRGKLPAVSRKLLYVYGVSLLVLLLISLCGAALGVLFASFL